MFEKIRQLIDDGRSRIEEAFVVPDRDDFTAVPPGVTVEQLIDEADQYVDAIIVPRRSKKETEQAGTISVPRHGKKETDQAGTISVTRHGRDDNN